MKKNIIKLIVTIVLGFILYYFMLPPINLSSPLFWVFIMIVLGFYMMIALFTLDEKGNLITANSASKLPGILLTAFFAVIIIILLVDFVCSPVFNAKSYSKRIDISEDSVFEKDVEEVNFGSMPLLDKESSQKLGDRVMGEMTELVSQFIVSDLYTQINYNDSIIRVTPLEYANVIKYFTNNKGGVKGYITVDSVSGKANLVKLDEGMQYMPSAIFGKDLHRKLRFSYPTLIFGDESFEIDNEGNPYWIVPTLKYTAIGLKKEVTGVVILDPITGESKKYCIDDIPTWVDHAYPAELIIDQTDNWGSYKSGFINSIFGQKNVVMTTEGYNYIAMKDDIYLYTGITSVTNDESITGFILSNLRTKETKFYSVSGAKEYSAMESAKGQVQEKNYQASFPLLINLNNKPTYFLSLKDNAGLVKMYAFVDVEDYQKVVVTDSSAGIEAAKENYLGDDEITSDKTETKEIEIKRIVDANVDGTTIYYITDTDDNKYKVSIKVARDILPFVEDGDELEITYRDSDNIKDITKIKD